MLSNRVLVSVRPDQLQLARQLEVGIELKLDRDHEDLVTGERRLAGLLAGDDVPTDRLVSVHPPPGAAGRRTDTSLTEDNVGNIVQFARTQLTDLAPRFVVLHAHRRTNIRDQLLVLYRVASHFEPRLAVENPPDATHWGTPEGLALFAVAASKVDTPWFLTVDTAHLDHIQPDGYLDEEELATVQHRASADGLDEGLVTAVRDVVTGRVTAAGAALPDLATVRGNPWLPTLRTLVLCGQQVQALHLNDPETDGIPALDRGDSPVLDAIFELVAQHDVTIVLEPDADQYTHEFLRKSVTRIQDRIP